VLVEDADVGAGDGLPAWFGEGVGTERVVAGLCPGGRACAGDGVVGGGSGCVGMDVSLACGSCAGLPGGLDVEGDAGDGDVVGSLGDAACARVAYGVGGSGLVEVPVDVDAPAVWFSWCAHVGDGAARAWVGIRAGVRAGTWG
jgi:hypothetical protein